MKKYYCVDCKKEVSDYRVNLCSKCFHSSKHNNYWLGKKRPEHSNKMKIIMQGRILTSEWKKKISRARIKLGLSKGKNNPMFGKHHTKESIRKNSLSQGGTGIPHERWNYPHAFLILRKSIRKRDNYICQLCHKKGRDVHHMDYNTFHNIETNLITLCEKCNVRVNYNRDYWFAYFTYIMEKIIKYKPAEG